MASQMPSTRISKILYHITKRIGLRIDREELRGVGDRVEFGLDVFRDDFVIDTGAQVERANRGAGSGADAGTGSTRGLKNQAVEAAYQQQMQPGKRGRTKRKGAR